MILFTIADVVLLQNGSPVLTNVIIANNTARYGGGLLVSTNSQLQCIGCVITGNQAEQYGGGVLGGGGVSYPTFTNSVLSGNAAQYVRGSIHGCCFDRHTDLCVLLPQGGGMYLSSITHATLQGFVL